jgi:hypothetical protein
MKSLESSGRDGYRPGIHRRQGAGQPGRNQAFLRTFSEGSGFDLADRLLPKFGVKHCRSSE